MTVAHGLVTAEMLLQMPADLRCELVQGEIIEMSPPGGEHGTVVIRLGSLLYAWSLTSPGGSVGTESGFVLARNPDTVRAPDVYYVRADRVPPAGVPVEYWDLAPDFAAEVVSPGDRAAEVKAKVHDYLQAGTELLWVIYPTRRAVVVHTPDGVAQTFTKLDVLENQAVLPGFRCTVSDIFG